MLNGEKMKTYNTIKRIMMAAAIIAAAIFVSAGAVFAFIDKTEYIPGEIIVKFKDGADPAAVLKETGIGVKAIERIYPITPIVVKYRSDHPEISAPSDEDIFELAREEMTDSEKSIYRTYKVTLAEGIVVTDATDKLHDSANVEYAEPNYKVDLQDFTGAAIMNAPIGTNDLVWGLRKIEAGMAWNITKGEGVIVAVIDTGVDFEHMDLSPNMWINRGEDIERDERVDDSDYNLKDDDGNGYIDDMNGWSFVPERGNSRAFEPGDRYGHGTLCAGAIAAAGNNRIGLSGVAPMAKIMAVKVLDDDGAGYIDTIVKGIIYAVDNRAQVLSCSWGVKAHSMALIDAFHYADSKGRVCVAAAGNGDEDVSAVSPANIDTVIAVAATDHNDEKPAFSNWGKKIDIAAPGVDIISSISRAYNWLMMDGSRIVGEGYYRSNGTSLACPYVAGAAALVLSQFKEYCPEQVKKALVTGSDNIRKKGDVLGYGRLNLFRALSLGPVEITSQVTKAGSSISQEPKIERVKERVFELYLRELVRIIKEDNSAEKSSNNTPWDTLCRIFTFIFWQWPFGLLRWIIKGRIF